MTSDLGQLLKKEEQRAKLARRIFFWLTFCILLVVIAVKGVALLPDPKPKPDSTERNKRLAKEYFGAENVIHLTSDSGGIVITGTGTYWAGDSDE